MCTVMQIMERLALLQSWRPNNIISPDTHGWGDDRQNSIGISYKWSPRQRLSMCIQGNDTCKRDAPQTMDLYSGNNRNPQEQWRKRQRESISSLTRYDEANINWSFPHNYTVSEFRKRRYTLNTTIWLSCRDAASTTHHEQPFSVNAS